MTPDSSNIDKYTSAFAFVILQDVTSIPFEFKNSPFKNVDIDKFFALIKEFLLYDLHVCDRCIFGFFGAEVRNELMQKIITEIALRVEKAREEMLDGLLDKLTIDNFANYLKTLQNTPDGEGLINDLNYVQIEYSKYKFTKEFDKGFEGQLEWEFGKKIASLVGHDNEASYVLYVTFRALGFFKLLMLTKKILEKKL